MDSSVATWIASRPRGVPQAALTRALIAIGNHTVSNMGRFGAKDMTKYYNAAHWTFQNGDSFGVAVAASRLGGRGTLLGTVCGFSLVGQVLTAWLPPVAVCLSSSQYVLLLLV